MGRFLISILFLLSLIQFVLAFSSKIQVNNFKQFKQVLHFLSFKVTAPCLFHFTSFKPVSRYSKAWQWFFMYQIQIWLKPKITIQNITSSTGWIIYISIPILNKTLWLRLAHDIWVGLLSPFLYIKENIFLTCLVLNQCLLIHQHFLQI